MKRVKLSLEQAEDMLPDGDTIHTFRNPGAGMLIGADWNRSDVLSAIGEFGVELAGEEAIKMNHGLVLRDGAGYLFLETKKPNGGEQ